MSAVGRLLADAEVTWHGTDLGLVPRLPDDGERLARELDEDDVPALLDALDRDETFVMAHVLLTHVAGVDYETSPTWNGLEVDLRPDGSAHVDPAQRPALVERWRSGAA